MFVYGYPTLLNFGGKKKKLGSAKKFQSEKKNPKKLVSIVPRADWRAITLDRDASSIRFRYLTNRRQSQTIFNDSLRTNYVKLLQPFQESNTRWIRKSHLQWKYVLRTGFWTQDEVTSAIFVFVRGIRCPILTCFILVHSTIPTK